MSRIASLEQGMNDVSELKLSMGEMKQQLATMFGRWEQEQKEREDEKLRVRAMEKGKGQMYEPSGSGATIGSRVHEGDDRWGPMRSPSPFSGREERSNGRGWVGQGAGFQGDRTPWKTRLLELPTFDGEEAESWILRVEEFFDLGDFTAEEKLRVVRLCFTGDALLWFRWERSRNPFRNWGQLKHRVLEQYSTITDVTAAEKLLTLQQEGTVKAFNREFISLDVLEIADSVLEIAYSNGLKSKIRAGMKMFDPRNLDQMMKMAKKVEEWENDEDVGGPRTVKPISGSHQSC